MSRELGQVVDEQGQGDLKGIDLGSKSHLHADGLQDLGNDETGPHLDQDHLLLAAPQQMQPQILLEGQKAQFDVPAPHIEPRYLPQRQEQRIAHIGNVLTYDSPTAEADEPHDMSREGIVGS